MAESDSLLRQNDQMEALSIAYAMAVSARAGYVTTPPPTPDRDSVDLSIKAGGSMRPQVDIQLKATSRACTWQDGASGFSVSRKNYDDLRCERAVPLLLVVLQLPNDEADWMQCDAEQLVMRRCAWWQTLRGQPAIDTDTCTIQLAQNQRFDPEALGNLMEQARSRARIGLQT